MTTKTLTPVSIQAPTSCPAGGTKASPALTGTGVDIRAYDGGDLGWTITNGSSAPGVGGAMTIQWSTDNGTSGWYDITTVGGDVAASQTYSGTIEIDPGMGYLRIIGWQNTTNAVTMGATFSGVTRS